jgi:hypothetical protein
MTLFAKCKIETTFKQRRVRKLPRRLDNSLIDKHVGHRIVLDSAEAFRLNIYLPVIDCLIGELERRFSYTSIYMCASSQGRHDRGVRGCLNSQL